MIDYYRGKDCLKKFCQDLKRQAKLVVDYEKKEMIKLTKEEQYKHDSRKVCFLCKKTFFEDAKNNYIKVRYHCHYTGKYRGAAHKICNFMYNTPREIPVVFHNGSSYNYHFIIKELAEEFEGDFECLGENKEKYITFSASIKNESNEGGTIIYKIKFIDSFRFMSISLSSLVDTLSGGIHNDGKCNNCGSSLEYISTKNGKLLFEWFDCNKRYTIKFNKKLIKKFKNTYRFCNENIDKFMLLLRKGVYLYEYMDDWSKLDEEELPNKSDFYSSFNMGEISGIDYRHAKKVFDKFNIKNLGEYHDLYVQSDTLLLADVFENFRGVCIKVYGLDPVYFLSATGLAWQDCLKKTGVKLELLKDIDMLLIVEKGIRGWNMSFCT